MEYARKITLLKKLLKELDVNTSEITVEETFAILYDLTITVKRINETRE
jgi:hypothetical protein